MNDAPAIQIEALEKHYGKFRALAGVDLAVPQGELLALVGHNGAGKTTLMKILLGLTRPSAGRVRVFEREPTAGGSTALRRHIGFLPENVVFAGGMSGREILRTFARLKDCPLSHVDALLERVGLAHAAAARLRTYSKGMRQRLGLAQALLGTPRLLLLDEPTTGLDPMLRGVFYEILSELQGRGATIMISSHILTELELRSDRIAILNRGRLSACDTLDGLYRAAGLPVRLRVHVTGSAAAARVTGMQRRVLQQNDHYVELAVTAEEKMSAIRELCHLDAALVRDMQIFTPSLDEVYAHFSNTPDDAA